MTSKQDRAHFIIIFLALMSVFAMLTLVAILLSSQQRLVKLNNADNRAQLCILSYKDPTREDIKHCYKRGEAPHDITIERYGEALK